MSGAPRYSPIAIALHWVVAVLVLVTIPLGLYMVGLKLSPDKLRIYSYHKWIGVTVFLLMLLRVAWRVTHPAPALPSAMRPWERHLAGAVHALLYLLLLAIPVSGWLFSSAAGFQTVYLGVIPLPDLLSKDKMLSEFLKFVHMLLAYTLAGLVAAHIGAALKHRFIDRDGVLERMLPFLARRRP